jgi:cytochrome P450
MTVFLGPKGNDFILNGKLKDVCAEDIYGPLTTPIFGKDVVYDCPNSKLMEQKKVNFITKGLCHVQANALQFMKFGLTTEAFRSYVTLISDEVNGYVKRTPMFKGNRGAFEVISTMAKVTIFTAASSLQGREVREKFDESFADLYHDLDQGFSPINFMLPWFPLPHNRRRDIAHKKMVEVYTDIVKKRRAGKKQDSQDMIWNLMQSSYKGGKQVPDYEIAHMMIALLMAGQHSSSSTISWVVLHLAERPDVQEALLAEQKAVLGDDLPAITYENLSKLSLHSQVIKETLRIHSPIHSIMRKVKIPMPISGTPWVVPTSNTLLATPLFAGVSEEYFPNAYKWDPRRWEENSGGIRLPSAEGDEEKIDYGYGMVSKGANSPYLPFGAGRHRCIGEQFAYVQLQTILANLVRLFKFSEGPGESGIPPTDYSVSAFQCLRLRDTNSRTSLCFRGLCRQRWFHGRRGRRLMNFERGVEPTSITLRFPGITAWKQWVFLIQEHKHLL